MLLDWGAGMQFLVHFTSIGLPITGYKLCTGQSELPLGEDGIQYVQ